MTRLSQLIRRTHSSTGSAARLAPRRIAWMIAGVLLATGLGNADERGELEAVQRLRKSRIAVDDLQAIELVTAFSGRAWDPEQAAGPPNVKQPGSNASAWTSLSADGQVEWLLCEYAEAVEVRAVVVHANAFPGAVSKVSVFNSKKDEVIAWEGEDPTPRDKPRGISVIPIRVEFPVQKIRVTIDSPAVSGWNEIDAIGLEDKDGTMHWAKHVEASTTYATFGSASSALNPRRAYAPEQVTGPPDATRPGDNTTAWCPATADGQAEWLVCDYKTPQRPAEIVVHENMSPGGVSRITAFNPEGKEVTIWEGTDPTPRDQPWGVSVFPVKAEFAFKSVKVYIDSSAVPGYQEIDAVGLRALDGETEWASAVEASSTYGVSMAASSARMTSSMPAMTTGDKSVRELQIEVEALRKQVEELKKLQKDLESIKELKDLLKDKRK